jgi:hypothetical protein
MCGIIIIYTSSNITASEKTIIEPSRPQVLKVFTIDSSGKAVIEDTDSFKEFR